MGFRGEGRWRGRGRDPAQAPRRLSAPPSPSPSPPGAAASTSALLPSPSQGGKTALDEAKRQKHTEVIKILEKYDPAYLAAQVGRAAPHPPPRHTAPAPCATDACSRIPGCSLTALSRPLLQ